LCHPRIETLTRHASANSKQSAVAEKERREIGLEQSVRTDTGEYEKRHISGAGKAVDDIGPCLARNIRHVQPRRGRYDVSSGQRIPPRQLVPGDSKQLLDKIYHFPPGFRPISFSTSLTMLRSTNWSRSGSGFPCGQPSSGVVRDSNKSFIRLGGISGLYLS
jgi:hypothetical protein